MCGFAGEFCYPAARADLELTRNMGGHLRHRGPDETGSFLSHDNRCALAVHRLSVIDIAESHQPMSSDDGHLTVAFNGEIYNFQQLRRDLTADGASFHTQGDTEILLHLYRRHGPGMLTFLDGMFAFAIYDRAAGSLFLARDRLGQKPLWYAPLDDRIVFASEAKALLAHPRVDTAVEEASLSLYLTIGYVSSPASVWRGIRKLSPAHFLMVSDYFPSPQGYWQVAPGASPVNHDDAVDAVRKAVTSAVQSHMIADVPLGVLLSGGVDSAIITAIMSHAAGRTGGLKTFTAGFDSAVFDERRAARRVAAHCNTDHTELSVRPDVTDAVDTIIAQYDEPFADSSALPTYLICREARRHVTVALVGDGGDEVFAGYDRHRAMHLAAAMRPGMYMASRLAAAALRLVAPHDERNRLRRFIRFSDGLPYPFAKQYLMYRCLFRPQDLPRLLSDEFLAGIDPNAPAAWFYDLYEGTDLDSEVARAQRHDLLTYLPNDLLVKTDTASMACSLELRAPFLDHRLVSLGLSLPDGLKIRGRRGKAILRDAFADMLPTDVFRRPKRGFAVPLGNWLRNELLDDLKETLLDPALAARGIFRPEALAGLINDHVTRRGDHSHRLWALLVLARWLGRRSV
ncbi:MAG: asparagine synthase (glutamine-hydrolyzing) [Phycisphaerae bacterium]|jgi:asparagine synthase (glutamine-hydrolysing)|nr:asparagine synthase (glutamine-hydrolyzing) [Phycisphaerae bacterium]